MLTLSSGVVGGSGRVAGGGALQWTLANDGDVPWPVGSTLCLVGGPMVASPVVALPAVAPGQTLDIELEIQEVAEPAEIFYSLVTPDGQPFGEIAHASVEHKIQPNPLVAVIASPMDVVDGPLDALQGELKSADWILGNVGQVPWPADVSVKLVYKTPGMKIVSEGTELPALGPGMTAHATLSALMPEKQGTWKAIWVVASTSEPDFGDILVAEFKVDEFPFMDWMAAAVQEAECVSDAAKPPAVEPSMPLSVSVAAQQHHFLGSGAVDFDSEDVQEHDWLTSLGRVTGVRAGDGWILEMALTNDGAEAWPAQPVLRCCQGSGMGCPSLVLGGGAVKPGETVLVTIELTAPSGPETTAWILTTGDLCFGTTMMLAVGEA